MPNTDAPLHGELLPIEFMNTLWADRDGERDALATPSEISGWLAEVRGDPRHRLTQVDASSARSLRDALRRLAAEATGDTRPSAQSPITVAQAVAAINAAAARAPSWSQLHWPRTGMPYRGTQSASPTAATLLGEIAEHGIDLFGGPDREWLRACYAPGCVLYFLRDHPRREWCSGTCGNRARVARHYQRHHGD